MMKPPAFSILSSSAEMTGRLAYQFGRVLKKGDVVLLVGPLGAGKTTFVQGVARAMGSKRAAVSPTFLFAETLGKRRLLHHLDFYRFSIKDLLARGVQDYFTGSADIPRGVLLIEWADHAKALWPGRYFLVRIQYKKGMDERAFTIAGKGTDVLMRLRLLKAALIKKGFPSL